MRKQNTLVKRINLNTAWGQQIACYKYFLGEVMKQTSI